MFKIIGIDEAGKGPVIGSLFIAFAIIHLEDKEEFSSYQQKLQDELGIKDSKKLSPKQRQFIYERLNEYMDVQFYQLAAPHIDGFHDQGGTLHELQLTMVVKMLEKERPNKVIIDALTANPEKFGGELYKRLSFPCEIVAENRADHTYPLVSAASVVAKELREEEVRQIKGHIGHDFGSGYPSDPKTKTFISENWNRQDFQPFIRRCWQTYKNAKQQSKDLGNYF